MARPRFLRRHYPHQVQGVRSTFRADHLSQAAPPHSILGQNKTHRSEVNKVNICRASVSGAGFGVSQKRPARAGETPAATEISTQRNRRCSCPSETANEKLSRGCRGRCLFYVRVKDGLPFSLVFLPDGGGVVGTRLVCPVVCAFNLHLVRCDDRV